MVVVNCCRCIWRHRRAPSCVGGQKTLPRASSPSMQPGGQTLQANRRAGPPGPTHWEAECQCALPAQHVRAARHYTGVVVMEMWPFVTSCNWLMVVVNCCRSIIRHDSIPANSPYFNPPPPKKKNNNNNNDHFHHVSLFVQKSDCSNA